MKELSTQIDRLIEEHGLLDEETMLMLKEIEGNSLEEKLHKIIEERNELTNEIKKLQSELNEETKKNQNLEELFSINDEEIDSEDKFIENQSKFAHIRRSLCIAESTAARTKPKLSLSLANQKTTIR